MELASSKSKDSTIRLDRNISGRAYIEEAKEKKAISSVGVPIDGRCAISIYKGCTPLTIAPLVYRDKESDM